MLNKNIQIIWLLYLVANVFAQYNENPSYRDLRNIEDPEELPNRLLDFFITYEKFRHCSTKKTCPKNEAFTRMEAIRREITNYVQNKDIQKTITHYQQDPIPNPAFVNDEIYRLKSEPSNIQHTYYQPGPPSSYGLNNRRIDSYQRPKSFEYHNEGHEFKTYTKKSIDYFPEPIIPLPLVPIQPIDVQNLYTYHVPKQNLYVQCVKNVQICVENSYCHDDHVYGLDLKSLKSEEYCNINTHKCCYLPKEEPRTLINHRPSTIINQISNSTIKELNNRIVKYLFLGRHNITLKNNKTVQIVNADNLKDVFTEIQNDNMTLLEVLANNNILVNTSDYIMNTVINSTIDNVNNYITRYIVLNPNITINDEFNFPESSDVDKVTELPITTTTPDDIQENNELEIQQLRNLVMQLTSQLALLTQTSSNRTQIPVPSLSSQTFINANPNMPSISEETTGAATEETTTEEITTKPTPRIKISTEKTVVPVRTYIPVPDNNAYLPPYASHHRKTPPVIAQRISGDDEPSLSVPISDVFGSVISNQKRTTLKTPEFNAVTFKPASTLRPAVPEYSNFQSFSTFSDSSLCPASMSCVSEIYCDKYGFISDIEVPEEERQDSNLDCERNGIKGKCCRQIQL